MNKKNLLLLCIMVFVIISFTLKHLTDDFFVFWAYGKQVNMNEAVGFSSLIETWDIKGALYRLYIYMEYFLTSSITSDVFTLQTQIIYKLFGTTLLLSILGLAVYSVPINVLKDTLKLDRYRLFAMSCISLLCAHFSSHFQPEMLGVFVLILAFFVSLINTKLSHVVAGTLIGATFFLKTPLIILAGTLFFGYLLFERITFLEGIKKLWLLILITFLTIIGVLAIFNVFYPQELIDIINASYYQHTLLQEHSVWEFAISFFKFGKWFIISSTYYPVILLALIIIIIAICQKKYNGFVLIFFMWIFPAIYVIISNCHFAYHYYLFVFPALISLFYCAPLIDYLRIRMFLRGLCIFLFVFYLISLSVFSPFNIFTSLKYQEILNKNKQIVNSIPSGNEVLYLDDGTGAFLFTQKSYLRYIYPLPIQRIEDGAPFASSKTYKEVYNTIMNYSGKYITESDWFYRYEHNEIKNKINEEYILLLELEQFSFNWDLFGESYSTSPLKLYVRK